MNESERSHCVSVTKRKYLLCSISAYESRHNNTIILSLQSRIESPWKEILICLYTLMIVMGGVGNLMVLYVVARNPNMRTARNVYVVNLAISDLMLCLITMPLTLVEILYLTWQFGNMEVFKWKRTFWFSTWVLNYI